MPAHLSQDGCDEDRGAFALPPHDGLSHPQTRVAAGDEDAVEFGVYCSLAAGLSRVEMKCLSLKKGFSDRALQPGSTGHGRTLKSIFSAVFVSARRKDVSQTHLRLGLLHGAEFWELAPGEQK